jgi:hypothetical protein
MILTGQDLDFLKQLRAAGERGRTVQTSSIRVALDRLAKGGFVVARPTGLDLVNYRITQRGRDASSTIHGGGKRRRGSVNSNLVRLKQTAPASSCAITTAVRSLTSLSRTSPAAGRRRTCSHARKRGGSPSTSRSCRSCCGSRSRIVQALAAGAAKLGGDMSLGCRPIYTWY